MFVATGADLTDPNVPGLLGVRKGETALLTLADFGVFGDVFGTAVYQSNLNTIDYDLAPLQTNLDATRYLVASAVPVPAAVWLLGSALVGLPVRRRSTS